MKIRIVRRGLPGRLLRWPRLVFAHYRLCRRYGATRTEAVGMAWRWGWLVLRP